MRILLILATLVTLVACDNPDPRTAPTKVKKSKSSIKIKIKSYIRFNNTSVVKAVISTSALEDVEKEIKKYKYVYYLENEEYVLSNQEFSIHDTITITVYETSSK